ncbi:hypothetical protein GGI12_000517 [Dipsacomyces acuminosporus]|nr:hypothetical protein GGI12_000517 [Dipsacomyces acuminosporus]
MAPFSDCTSIGVDAKAAASIAGAHLLPADTEYAEEEQAPGIEPSEDAIRQIIMLRDAQNDFERRLAEHRKRIVHEQEKVLRQIEAREIVCPMPRKEQDEILRQHRLELERTDKRTIEKLDELRYQQQISLQSLGVDGFYPSSSVAVMERQRSILKHLLSKHSS